MTAFGGALDDPTKIMGSRIGAYVVDVVVMLALIVGFFFAFDRGDIASSEWESPGAAQDVCDLLENPSPSGGSSFVDGTVAGGTCVPLGSTTYVLSDAELERLQGRYVLITFGVSFLNLVLLQGLTGASVGKRLFGLRVANGAGLPAGIGWCALRWIILPIDAACLGIVGLATSFTSKGHRRLGDMAANTYVVHRSALGRPLAIPGLQTIRAHGAYGGWGPAPTSPLDPNHPDYQPPVSEGGGIDGPTFDPGRNTYVRFDLASGVWFAWNDDAGAWQPVEA